MAEKIKSCIPENVVPFRVKLRKILKGRNITTSKFEWDTGITRNIFYRDSKHHKSLLMAIAYYLDITVEELVEGTTAMDDWYC